MKASYKVEGRPHVVLNGCRFGWQCRSGYVVLFVHQILHKHGEIKGLVGTTKYDWWGTIGNDADAMRCTGY